MPSVKLLIAPLLDQRNMVVIILVAIFFGVYRMSGGGMQIKSRQLRQNKRTFFNKKTPKVNYNSNIPKRGKYSNRKANLLDDILKDNDRKPVKQKGTQSSSKLDNIEKSLGLR